MKILVYSAHPYEIPFLRRAAGNKHELIFSEQKLSKQTAGLAKGCEAIALFTADDASSPVLEKLHDLKIKFIALRSAGYDHVDLPKATELKIQVANVPSYSPNAIAEHAVALLLALNRKIVESQRLLDSYDFRLDTLVGFDVHGKKVGVVGIGTIGLEFIKIMNGFGAELFGYDPQINDYVKKLGVKYVSFNELIEICDIISLHCPLNAATRHLFSKPVFEKMKSNAVLINTTRGAVVKTIDLVEALEEGRIGGAALDVYENEKPIFFEDHSHKAFTDDLFVRLRSNKRVIVTGHQAFLTQEALTGIATTTIQNFDYWTTGMPNPNGLNRY